MDEYLRKTRRKRSEEFCDPGSRPHSRGPVTSVSRAPANISRAQRLLQTGMLARQGGPLVPERLELHIPAIRHSYTMQQVTTEECELRSHLCCREMKGQKEEK